MRARSTTPSSATRTKGKESFSSGRAEELVESSMGMKGKEKEETANQLPLVTYRMKKYASRKEHRKDERECKRQSCGGERSSTMERPATCARGALPYRQDRGRVLCTFFGSGTVWNTNGSSCILR